MAGPGAELIISEPVLRGLFAAAPLGYIGRKRMEPNSKIG